MAKLVSTKAQKEFKYKLWVAEDALKELGGKAFLSNRPCRDETKNMIKDMLRLAKYRPKSIEQDLKLGVYTPEKAELERKKLTIVKHYLDERLRVYNWEPGDEL